MSIEQKIKEEAIKISGNVKSFAQEIGIPYTTFLSMLSNGLEKSSVDNVIKVAKKLNLKIDDLLKLDVDIDNVGDEKDNIIKFTVEKTKDTQEKTQLLTAFDKLNNRGQLKAIETVEDMTYNGLYNDNYQELIAAHNDSLTGNPEIDKEELEKTKRDLARMDDWD